MERIKKLLPQEKHLRLTVIFFVLGLIVRLVFFIKGDIVSAMPGDERSENDLACIISSLTFGNFVLVYILTYIFNLIIRLTGAGITALAGVIGVQIINIVIDCLFLKAVYKLDKRFTPVISMLSTLYMLSYIVGLALGLIFFQVPFNLLTLIAAFIFYRYRVPEAKDETTKD